MRAPSQRTILSTPPGRVYYGDGLCLKVTPTSRNWIFRYTSPLTRRPNETTIGSAFAFTYDDARNEIMRMRQWLARGADPVQEKRKERAKGTTFAEACEGWINKHKSKWRSLRHINILIRKHAQPLADIPVRAITSPMIVEALSDLWQRHPEQAHRALSMWGRVFNYAKAMGYRDGDNPAMWSGNLENIFPGKPKNSRKHYPSLPFKHVPELMRRLHLRRAKGHSAAALEFQILCASRPSEVLNMRWSELDLINRIWTLPPERTKQNREHRVPFSVRCMEILSLQNEYRTNDFVFTGYNKNGEARPLNPKALRDLLRAMNVPVTPHGFRASFRNWGARAFPHSRDLLEMCLGHQIKREYEAAYWTHDEIEQRRPIMEAWASYCG
jgi:integrase